MPLRFVATAALAVLLVASPAVNGQVLMQRDVSLRMALTIAETALAQCGIMTSVAVVDRAGRLRVFLQGDGAAPHNIELARRKAYTARTFRSPSGALVDRVKADPTLGLIHLTNVIANQGALPIKVGRSSAAIPCSASRQWLAAWSCRSRSLRCSGSITLTASRRITCAVTSGLIAASTAL